MQQPTPTYRRYVLILLTLVYALNFIDRQILVILQESIKLDMGLSDTQLGLLTGFAFAIFYVSVGIPIARWADVGNRRNIISIAITVWSGMTAISGLTQNYWQLLLARIGVGVGEAGGSPPAHSIISDYYPPEERGRALSFYSTGVYLGVLIGFLAGGWINHMFGWRMAFFVVGVPGFLVALLVRFTIQEPQRGMSEANYQVGQSSLKETLQTLWQLKSFRLFSLAAGLSGFVNYGVGNFFPSFLIRVHQYDAIQVGTALALITGIGGAIGTYLGGWIADKFGSKDLRWYLWACAIPSIMSVPMMLLALNTQGSQTVLAFLFFGTLFAAFYLGPTIAITHILLPPHMRAMGSAVLFFILNLIGLGLGPVFTGMVSDSLTPSYGSADGIRYAMMTTSLFAILAAVAYGLAATILLKDESDMRQKNIRQPSS
mgnify:CR=1 FL=1